MSADIDNEHDGPSSSTKDEGPIFSEVELQTLTPTFIDEPPERESFRGTLAGWLLAGFLGQVVIALITALIWPDRTDQVLRVLSVVLTPTVAILGTVTGFYFGAKPKDRG